MQIRLLLTCAQDSGQYLKQHHRRDANQSSPAVTLTKKWKIKTYQEFLFFLRWGCHYLHAPLSPLYQIWSKLLKKSLMENFIFCAGVPSTCFLQLSQTPYSLDTQRKLNILCTFPCRQRKTSFFVQYII